MPSSVGLSPTRMQSQLATGLPKKTRPPIDPEQAHRLREPGSALDIGSSRLGKQTAISIARNATVEKLLDKIHFASLGNQRSTIFGVAGHFLS
jgi:hypothetical protein